MTDAATPPPAALSVGFLVFPGITQLDLTGPQEVLARVPGATTALYWKTLEPVRSASSLMLLPTRTFEDQAPIDLLCIPGGPGQIELMTDTAVLAWVRETAARSRWVTSVCTGSLVLAAAGLLRGRRATTHWSAMEDLTLLGAHAVPERVVVDGNIITGAGVTSGIDFALQVVADLYGAARAQAIQLSMEYDPKPPFASAGSPATADPEVVTRLRDALTPLAEKRRAATLAACAASVYAANTSTR
jgi:cyclohexyl-isocyanide hydratase